LGLPAWILFFAFVPLLFLDNFFEKHKESFPIVSFWGHVFLATFIWNVAASWWMAQASMSGVVSAMIFNAFLMSLVWWAAHFIRRTISSSLGYIALVVFWISYEYLQFNWDMEWPCLQLGSILASDVKTIQWYEYTGAFGGTLWVLLLNVLLFQLVQYIYLKTPIQQSIIALFSFTIVLVFPLLLSSFMYYSYAEKENPRQIAIVQPNVDPYLESYDMEAENEKLNNFLRLAGEVCSDEIDFLIGPETVFENQWYWNEDQFSSNEFLHRMLSFVHGYKKAELVFGVSSFKVYGTIDEATHTARNKDGMLYDRYSTALFVNRQGDTQVYHKSKLVMGVEKTPFQKYFPSLKNLFIDLGGASGNLGIQNEATNFVSADGTLVAPVICFESVFGEYVTDFVKNGAELIFVITNDGWWKNSRGYKQHLLFSQLRAIECRRSIARAANTGTSCFINQRGEVVLPTIWWEEAAIKGSVNANDELTFYVLYGDYIARMAVFMSIFLGLFLFAKQFKSLKKDKKNPH
jgi:apolipoprotein N-acyltransferase